MSIEASAPQAIIYDLTETVESTLLSTFSFRRSCWLRARPRVWEDGEGLFVRKGIKLNVVVLDLEEVDQKKRSMNHILQSTPQVLLLVVVFVAEWLSSLKRKNISC